MVYQTQEMMAKDVIGRLKTAGADTMCLWLHTSQLSAENKNPNKINMIAHLLEPLTQATVCRAFFLQSKDILLIGSPDLETMAMPQIERIRRVLSDDAFVQSAGNDFWTAYPILTHSDLLISALGNASHEMPVVKAPSLWERLEPQLNAVQISEVVSVDTVLKLTPQNRQTVCKLYLPSQEKIASILRMPKIALNGIVGAGCIRQIWNRNSDLFNYYNSNVLPSFIYFNALDVMKSGFDLFMGAREQKTIICLSAEELLSDADDFMMAVKKMHVNRVSWALCFRYAENLDLIDFTKIRPDWVCVPYLDDFSNELPVGLKKEKIILTGVDVDSVLLEALRQGFSYFSGRVVNLILGTSCQQRCPYGDTCAQDVCRHIWTGKVSDKQCVFEEFRTRFILNECEDV